MLATAVVACGGGDEGDDPVAITAAAYSAVIDEFLPPDGFDDELPVVYVARLGEEAFPLEDQVAMLERVQDTHDLRFVDDIAAALDDQDLDESPRDDGLLIGVGTISARPPHVVRVEVYEDADRVDASKVTLSLRNDEWRVDTSEPVDAEGLVGDD